MEKYDFNFTPVEYDINGVHITLNSENIWACVSGDGTPTPDELIRFAYTCQTKQLNPFTNEVWLIKNGTAQAFIQPGRDGLMAIAARNPRFEGIESGVIVMNLNTGSVDCPKGSFYMQSTQELLGAWAQVHIKGYKVPIYDSVIFNDYSTGRDMWYTHSSTMIQKVAESRALRKGLPESLSGLYSNEERTFKEYSKVSENTSESDSTKTPTAPKTEKKEQEQKKEEVKKFVPRSLASTPVEMNPVEVESSAESVPKPVKEQKVTAANPVPDIPVMESKNMTVEEAMKVRITSTGLTIEEMLTNRGHGHSDKTVKQVKNLLVASKAVSGAEGLAAKTVLEALKKKEVSFKMIEA